MELNHTARLMLLTEEEARFAAATLATVKLFGRGQLLALQ